MADEEVNEVETTEATEQQEAQPEEKAAPPAEDRKTTLVVDGQPVHCTQTELEQLAYHGATALFASYNDANNPDKSAEQAQSEAQKSVTDDIYEEDAPEWKGKVEALEAQVQQQQSAIQHQATKSESDKIAQQVEELIASDNLLKTFEDEKRLQETKWNIYNRIGQRNESPEQAVKAYSENVSDLLGEERSSYLISKLKDQAGAQESTGGSVSQPAEPLSGSDLFSGKVKDAALAHFKSAMRQ